MQTTLDIDQDVLEALERFSVETQRPAGKVVSDILRENLRDRKSARASTDDVVLRNGLPVFRANGKVVTVEHVRRLMEETE